jgi:ribonucleotide reductase, class II
MKHLQTTPTAAFIFYRSYSRFIDGARETWQSMALRCVLGLGNLGKFTEDEVKLIYSQIDNCTALPSGRYMWCGGTKWSDKQANFEGSYNCAGHVVDDISVFGRIMDLSMKGAGCGAVLELDAIAKLPPIKTKLNIEIVCEIGTTDEENRQEDTVARFRGTNVDLVVGDSRRGWVESYVGLIQLAVSDVPDGEVTIRVDLSSIRPAGDKLSGFGGVANPVKLPELYGKVAAILNGAIGRQLTSVECCLLICEAAAVVVAGNIRRSALIFQFSSDDLLARTIKDNLWAKHDDGTWYMPNPALSSLVMGNHTTVFHTKPTLDECIASVTKQYYSGEGAIQWAGEAVARANADLLDTPDKKSVFLGLYPNRELAKDWLKQLLVKRLSESDVKELVI